MTAETPEGRRRPPTAEEAKALAHPLRLQILRLTAHRDLTNKQLADALGTTPGTMLHHVRLLLRAGFLIAAPIRSGESGALEKPYRSSGATWWLDNPLAGAEPDVAMAPLRLFMDEAAQAGPDDLASYAGFTLHLSPDEVDELDRQLLAVLDRWIDSDEARRGRPVHRGLIAVLRLPS